MKKRGQVTVFIILAVVVIILVAAYYFITGVVYKDEFQSEIQKHKNVPLQIQPVNDFLDSCTADLAKEGLVILGINGGYFTPPEDSMPTSSINPIHSTLEIFPNTNPKVALWFREQPNGIPITSVPSTAEISAELADYISTNYIRCLDNLTAFTEQGFDFVIAGTAISAVDIKQSTVNVNVQLPVQVTKQGIIFSLESHLAQLNSRFGELYNVATQILNSENTKFFLENKTIDALVAYDPEIPFTGVNTNCNERSWSKREVTQKLKDVISANTALSKIKGTNYEIQDDKYDYLAFDALGESHNDITVNMLYSPSWPTAVEIQPSDGDLLKEDSISKKTGPQLTGLLSTFFCLNTHHFVYTIKYPILITITAPNNELFQFATEVIVDRNEPRKNSALFQDVPDTAAQLCKYPQHEIQVETYAINSAGNIVPVNGADIYFKCSPVTCKSELTDIGPNKYLVKVPACYNGIVEARKEGYYNGKALGVSTNKEITTPISIIMTPLYKKNVKVFVIDKDTGEIRKPYDSEQVIFEFNKNTRQEPYSATFIYPSGDDSTITLIPGYYNITSYVLGKSTWPITTQKQSVEHCVTTPSVFGLFGGEEKCMQAEIPSVTMDSAFKGGVSFDYEFKPEGLGKDSELVLYTMAASIPADLDSMAAVYGSISTNSEDSRFKYPEM